MSVQHYFLENSAGLFTVNNAGILGWYDSDYPTEEYWRPDKQPGRDSGAEAIRKAAHDWDFASWDANGDGRLTVDELAILFIIPGTGYGGGLGRIVGEDYTTRETATGITIDGVKITWIAEVSIAPPRPGIVAHELAHLLIGHGDMYFGFFTPSAAGPYSLMDQHHRAPHIDPLGKLKCGWLKPRIVFRSGRYRLSDVETHCTAYILIDPERGADEYFIVENRWRATTYDSVLPDQGIAVWHIMEDPATFNSARLPPNVAKQDWDSLGAVNWGRKAIRMIRPILTRPADYRLWEGSDPATAYDLRSLDPDPLHATLTWGDGTPSGFEIRAIPAAGPTVEFELYAG